MSEFDQVVTFYVGAHQDDWQLFRGDRAWNDVKCGAKVVFVYLTAGDDDRDEFWWRAREAASMASVEAMTGLKTGLPTQAILNEKPITRYDLSLTRSYFLRLPDGGFNRPGIGFERTGFQSLTLLRTSGKAMTTVDGTATYGTWQELIDTISAILSCETESSSSTMPRINTSRRDRLNHPGDHFDHYEVGEIIAAIAADRYQVVGWAGYTNRPRRLQPDALEKKRFLMRAYRAAMKARVDDFDLAGAERHDEGLMAFEGE